jgi:hypothetical protein
MIHPLDGSSFFLTHYYLSQSNPTGRLLAAPILLPLIQQVIIHVPLLLRFGTEDEAPHDHHFRNAFDVDQVLILNENQLTSVRNVQMGLFGGIHRQDEILFHTSISASSGGLFCYKSLMYG